MAHRTRPTDPAQQSVFDPPREPRARSSNPETSKAAASSVRNLRASHQRVLAMFKTYGDMTDETLQKYLDELAEAKVAPRMSVSGVRSRRSELSKPNMDRMAEIIEETRKDHERQTPSEETLRVIARARLLIEGLRSPLWDTGKRETLPSGRQAIVWGLAR